MKASLLAVLVTVAISTAINAQPTSERDMLQSVQNRKTLAQNSILKDYPVRNIGPTIQGGRIVDIDVNLKDTKEFYLGYASGGIFKTVNNGITFEPIFDKADMIGVGDFVLSQKNPQVMYVGTGEKNSSRSSYAGAGVFKTTDGGKTWSHVGLTATQHISRVLVHPDDENTVWVAAIGALYTPNADRGVFKSTDGGKSWKKTLYINDSTGVIDMVINPKNPRQLFASTWERSRRAWNFKGNGEASAIYKSEDGGETWTKSSNGFASGKTVGRIGLDISAANPNVVYAILDNQLEVEDKKAKKDDGKLKIEAFKTMSKDAFLALDNKKLDEFLKDNGFPKKYNAELVKREIRENKYDVAAIANYFGSDANANLFRTKIVGAELFRSEDGGANWKKMNGYDLDGVFFTYGYYFAEMEVSPTNANQIYIYGVPLLKSNDGGASWHRLDTLRGVNSIHVDHHVVWVDPNDSRHILLGNDGGLYVSYDEGANWAYVNNMPVGQFYTVNVDMETPYNVYGGLQDNGVLRGSSKSVPNETQHWEELFGGDGMYAAPDPRNSQLVYTGFQFGNYFRLDLDKSKTTKITPQHNVGETPYRWNWRTPLFLSKHNPDVVYMASHLVHRSMNKGESFDVISPDLTTNRKQGNVPFSSISSLAESPLKFGLLYAGTDDGNLWISRGGDWQQIGNGLPRNKWISSVTPSSIDEGTVFVSLNGYRDDDFTTYIYMSTDYGKTWKDIKGNLPQSVANVVIQDPINPDLLYCGLDNGTYVSLDRGQTWHVMNGMLNVAAYDMMVHPRDYELVVGTHGRSVFVADVKPLEQLKDGAAAKGIVAFAPESVRFNERWGEKQYEWSKASEPKIEFFYYVGKPAASVNLEIIDEKNAVVRRISGSGTAGFHTVRWDGKVNAPAASTGKKGGTSTAPPASPYVAKGKYKLRFTNGTESSEVPLEVK